MTFDSEQISELLNSDNLHFCKIASKTIIDEFEVHSRLFFTTLLNRANCEDLVQYAFQRFPSLNEGFEKPNLFLFSKNYQYFSEYANDYVLFLSKLQEYFIIEIDEDKRKKLINRLTSFFDGLSTDLCHLYPQYYALCKRKDIIERQLMIFITGKCNLNCPYCFSIESQYNEMSISDFNEILQWAKTNQFKKISLCGGEPTSHSHFDGILQLIYKYGFKTYFASNFTIDCTLLENFNTNVIEKIYIHLTNHSLENPYLKNQLFKNIEYAKKAKIALACRTNIANENPPIAAWFQFLQETNIQTLNIALTFPTLKANNQFVDIYSFGKYRSVIVQIINKAKEQNIDLSFAKPVPMCIFDEAMSHYLLTVKNFQPLCNVSEQNCTRNFCITPQKEVHACLGVTSRSLKFRENMKWTEIENFCTNIIQPLLSKPLWTKCNDCFLFDRKLCQGACLSYKIIP